MSNLETVPCVSLALGSVAGLGAARSVMAHYSVMVTGISQIFVAGRRSSPASASTSPRRSWAARRSTCATAPSTTRHPPRPRRSPAPAASSRTCRARSTTFRRGPNPRRSLSAQTNGSSRPSRATAARCTRCAASSSPSSTAVRSSRSAGCGAAARSRAWRASTAGRSACWPPIPTTTAPDGRRRVRQDHPLRRPLRHVPPAGRPPRRPARLPHRRRRRACVDHPPRRPGARRGVPGAHPVVLGDPAPGVRRGRRRAPPAHEHPRALLRLAVG